MNTSMFSVVCRGLVEILWSCLEFLNVLGPNSWRFFFILLGFPGILYEFVWVIWGF